MTESDNLRQIWRPIPGGARYEVSDYGYVRRDGKVLATRVSNAGYVLVNYTDDTTRKRTRTVHTIVLEAFRGYCPPGMEACHGNDDPLDNRLDNLRWDTPEANRADQRRNRPGRICIVCETRPVTKGGRRCHECVVKIALRAASLLQDGVPLGEACKQLDYPSPEGLHTLARKYGGYGQRPEGPPLPAALPQPAPRSRSVPVWLVALRTRLGWR